MRPIDRMDVPKEANIASSMLMGPGERQQALEQSVKACSVPLHVGIVCIFGYLPELSMATASFLRGEYSSIAAGQLRSPRMLPKRARRQRYSRSCNFIRDFLDARPVQPRRKHSQNARCICSINTMMSGVAPQAASAGRAAAAALPARGEIVAQPIIKVKNFAVSSRHRISP